jgi:type IV pilus assembly protein PilX
MTTILVSQRRTAARGPRRQPAYRLALHQRGVVLFIALIVLVAMTMAGIAIMRSVDTGNLISGNVAFKQATLQAGDNGIIAAINYLLAQEFTGQLDNNFPTAGYTAVGYNQPGQPSNEPDWSDDATWNNSIIVGTDANGNKVEYLINRLCQTPGSVNGNNCAKLQTTGGKAGNGQGYLDGQPSPPPMVFFRITTRVTGPRGATSIIQFDVALQQ